MNVKVRSGCTVISVGVGIPGWRCAVRALNSLQKSMALTPRAPSAGPMGGVGEAFPAARSKRYMYVYVKDVTGRTMLHTTI